MRKSEASTRRSHGDGAIDERGPDTYRLRYRVDGKRFTKTFKGSIGEARKELRRLIRSGDIGEHVEPDKITVAQWIKDWLDAGAPGRRKKRVSERTLERYADLLRVHVVPTLGPRRLQALQATEIDKLYADMATAAAISPRTQHHVHVVLGSALSTATRKGMLSINPMLRVEQVPTVSDFDPEAEDDDIGEGLSDAELRNLIEGFETSTIFPIVVAAAATGARRNELLALRWTDLDPEKRTLRIERAWEQTKKHGLRLKAPKTQRGLRTIDLDAGTVSVLLKERETLQRLVAGVPDGSDVDLGLVKLPTNTLMFPNPAEAGEGFSLTTPRNPRSVTQAFARRAETIGFGRVRFHDLRGIHSTALLDANIPVHTVAQRIGDDPATLLRSYAKRKRSKQADERLSETIAGIAAGFLKS
jgi:integrase